MPLARKYQKIFGKNADATDLSIVGSKSEDNPQYSADVEAIQSLSNWETGMRAIVTSSSAPYLQDQNSLFYVITSQLAYLFQAGVAEWNSQTEYIANRSVVFKNGKIYVAIANSTNIEPEVAEGWNGYWRDILSTGTEKFYLINSSVGAAREEIRLDLSVNGRLRVSKATGLFFSNENNQGIGSIDVSGTREGNDSAVNFVFNSFTINGNPIIRIPDYSTKTQVASSDNNTTSSWTATEDGWILAKFISATGTNDDTVFSINNNAIINEASNHFFYSVGSGGYVRSLFPIGMYPVKKGDVVRVRRGIRVYFYKYR